MYKIISAVSYKCFQAKPFKTEKHCLYQRRHSHVFCRQTDGQFSQAAILGSQLFNIAVTTNGYTKPLDGVCTAFTYNSHGFILKNGLASFVSLLNQGLESVLGKLRFNMICQNCFKFEKN